MQLKQAFAAFDADDDGKLSSEELAQIMTHPHSGAPVLLFSERQVQEIVHTLNHRKYGNGLLSLDVLAATWIGVDAPSTVATARNSPPAMHPAQPLQQRTRFADPQCGCGQKHASPATPAPPQRRPLAAVGG